MAYVPWITAASTKSNRRKASPLTPLFAFVRHALARDSGWLPANEIVGRVTLL
jgi:hypothetical protein